MISVLIFAALLLSLGLCGLIIFPDRTVRLLCLTWISNALILDVAALCQLFPAESGYLSMTCLLICITVTSNALLLLMIAGPAHPASPSKPD